MIQDKAISRQQLLETFQNLSIDFQLGLSDAKQRELQFKNVCQNFQKNIQGILSKSTNNLSTNNPLSGQVKAFIQLLQNTSEQWNSRISKQDTGVRFRENFNDSLLVFVYGKVKSGKSSLGNYIAWGHTDPNIEIKVNTAKNLQPQYFSGEKTNVKNGDQVKEAETNQEFRVGATEATSSIQGFKLPGLTWVDSPGLHSINAENGQLAKDYVEHADLILYTMKSDSPGRASDLAEILELYRADKKILLLLTGSDDTKILGFDAILRKPISKIIMKDAQRRADQRAYIRTALEEIPELTGKTTNIDIVSFSARYAQLNVEDAGAFQDSGMSELFKTIQETAFTNGVRLKQQTPLKNFKNFIQHFQRDLDLYESSISNFHEPIEQLKKNIPIEVTRQFYDVQKQITDVIDHEFAQLDSLRDDAQAMQARLKEIGLRLNETLKQKVNISKTKVIEQLMNDFGDKMVSAFEQSALLTLPEFSIEQKTETIVSGVKASTKNRNGGWGGLLGATILGGVGLLVGGPAGAAVGVTAGAGLGKSLGGATGDNARTITKDIIINVGDNLNQIHNQTLDVFRTALNKEMTRFQDMLLQNSLDDAEDLIQSLSQELQNMQKNMNVLYETIESKLKA